MLRYVIPLSAAKMLNEANTHPEGVRFDTIMGADEAAVYEVEETTPTDATPATKTAWQRKNDQGVQKAALTQRAVPVSSCCTAS